MRCEVCGLPGPLMHFYHLKSMPVTSPPRPSEATVTSEVHMVHEECMPKMRERWENDDLAYAISDYLSGGDAQSAPKLNRAIARIIAEHRALWGEQ